MRILKTLFALSIALLCLFYATQNVVNLEACYAAFAYVFSHADHVVYAKSFFPAISSPALIWMTLAVVVGLEFLAGILAARGFWAMWAARTAGAAALNAEKHYWIGWACLPYLAAHCSGCGKPKSAPGPWTMRFSSLSAARWCSCCSAARIVDPKDPKLWITTPKMTRGPLRAPLT